jgi:Domain of unknown function (DUF4148)
VYRQLTGACRLSYFNLMKESNYVEDFRWYRSRRRYPWSRVLSFAQSNPPLTRAEVRADLVHVEHVGYIARSNDINYPLDNQAAEAKIAARNEQKLTNQAVGGVAENGRSASGSATDMALHSTCVGPVSFCNLFFGS